MDDDGVHYEGTSLIENGKFLTEWRNKHPRKHPITSTHVLLITLILIGCTVVYSESRRETGDVLAFNYTNFHVANFDAKLLSKEDRITLLEKILAEDEQEALIDGSGEEAEAFIKDKSNFNYDVLEEEIIDEERVQSETSDLDKDIEFDLDLSDDQVAQRFQYRNELFKEECGQSSSLGPVTRSDLNFTIASLSNVFYDDKYKIIMCAVPKAATSNWQRVLAVLKYDGKIDPSHFHHSNLYNQLNRFSHLAELGEEEAKSEILKRINDPTYIKFMNVRHPLSRLVSAWRDKFRRTASGMSYWMRKYGKFINAKFGRDEYPIPDDYFVSLPAFLDYVAWVGRDERYDHHWKSFNYHCRPCQLKFDYITKAETSKQDADFILKRANISDIPNVSLPEMYDSSPLKSHSPEDYYVNVSHVTIERLHHAYRNDFRLFGYSSTSFEHVACGTTPEIFTERKRRDLRRKRHLINPVFHRKLLKRLLHDTTWRSR